jgi:hypothetical protein
MGYHRESRYLFTCAEPLVIDCQQTVQSVLPVDFRITNHTLRAMTRHKIDTVVRAGFRTLVQRRIQKERPYRIEGNDRGPPESDSPPDPLRLFSFVDQVIIRTLDLPLNELGNL